VLDKYFVTQNHEIITGDSADFLLEETNDLQYYTKDGVLSVPYDRWLTAQQFEQSCWMEKGLNINDDRNFHHYEKFLSYKSLREVRTEKVLELGCGPFSNSRLLVPFLHGVREIHLLDPLISNYLMHPHCTYKDGKLCEIPVVLHNVPIEEFETEERFGVVVLINVLEHCFNVSAIFDKIHQLLFPGGVFVFAEAGIEAKDVEYVSKFCFDVGHPQRVTVEYMGTRLAEYEQLFRSDFTGLYNQKYRRDIYFVGRKK
jgi:SAM-dependent methyltransferase